MPEPVLTTRRLNRSLLARQLLLERADLSIPAALEQVGGLQTQYAPSGYIGLWTRIRGFRRDSLTEALEARSVIQATLMRTTIHMVSAADYWLLAAGTRRARREWWRRVTRKTSAGLDMEAHAERLRSVLAPGPRRQAELLELLAADGVPREAWNGLGAWVDMVRVPPAGTWARRRADIYGLAQAWLPHREPVEAQGLELLLRRYLAAFGPGALADAARWAGVPPASLRPIAERLDLRRFRDEASGELLDLPDLPIPPEDIPAPARFLPSFDATLLVHARRTLILPERYRPIIFDTHAPQSFPTFLVDGAVAGTWRHTGDGIEITAFEPLAPADRQELEAEAVGLGQLHGQPALEPQFLVSSG